MIGKNVSNGWKTFPRPLGDAASCRVEEWEVGGTRLEAASPRQGRKAVSTWFCMKVLIWSSAYSVGKSAYFWVRSGQILGGHAILQNLHHLEGNQYHFGLE